VSSLNEKAMDYAFGPSQLFSNRFPLARPIRAPSLVGALMHATAINSAYHIRAVQDMADLLIQPSLERFGIMCGYERAQPHIQAWKTNQRKSA
jgi:hypothetical protein